MNITVVTTIYPPDIGGPATYTFEVKKRLEDRGHNVKILTTSPNAPPGDSVFVVPKRLRLRFIGFLLHQLRLLFALLKLSKGADVIYTQNPTYLGFISFLCCWILKKPVVLRFVGDKTWENAFNSGITDKSLEEFLQNPTGGIYTKFIFHLQKFVMRQMRKIIVPSNFLREVLLQFYRIKPEKVRVIYNSVEIPTHLSRVKEKHNAPTLLFVGRLIKHKRVEQLITVVKKLSVRYPGIKLLIVGGGPEKENLEKLSQELRINNQVRFCGKVSHKETAKLLAKADIFVLNSVYEGLPHVVLEAMACKTPVITTNIKGTNEVVKDGETGLLVSPNNNEELKQKLIRLLKDEELRKRLVENAYKSVEEKFTWEKNLSVLEKELEEVT